MTWTAVPNIAGVTIAGVYQAFATTPPWTGGTAAANPGDFTVDGTTGDITIVTTHLALGGWMRFTFTDTLGTLAGVPEYPAINARLTVNTAGAVGALGNYDFASRLASDHNDQILSNPQVQTGVYDGTGFSIAAGTDGIASDSPAGITLLFELDITLTASSFWTDNVECVEDTGVLTKPSARVFVPEVEGQPFIPASYNCYPPPPPPPPPPVTPPGGGGGSGPPHGECYDAPVFEYFILCHGYPEGDPRGSPPCLPTQVLVGYVRVCP